MINRIINNNPTKTKNLIVSVKISHYEMSNNSIFIRKGNPRIKIISFFTITIIVGVFIIYYFAVYWE